MASTGPGSRAHLHRLNSPQARQAAHPPLPPQPVRVPVPLPAPAAAGLSSRASMPIPSHYERVLANIDEELDKNNHKARAVCRVLASIERKRLFRAFLQWRFVDSWLTSRKQFQNLLRRRFFVMARYFLVVLTTLKKRVLADAFAHFASQVRKARVIGHIKMLDSLRHRLRAREDGRDDQVVEQSRVWSQARGSIEAVGKELDRYYDGLDGQLSASLILADLFKRRMYHAFRTLYYPGPNARVVNLCMALARVERRSRRRSLHGAWSALIKYNRWVRAQVALREAQTRVLKPRNQLASFSVLASKPSHDVLQRSASARRLDVSVGPVDTTRLAASVASMSPRRSPAASSVMFPQQQYRASPSVPSSYQYEQYRPIPVTRTTIIDSRAAPIQYPISYPSPPYPSPPMGSVSPSRMMIQAAYPQGIGHLHRI